MTNWSQDKTEKKGFAETSPQKCWSKLDRDPFLMDEYPARSLREVFIKQRHTRFMKSLSYHLPFGTREAYVKEITATDLNKLASLIKICGFLMQTKVYVFWSRN